ILDSGQDERSLYSDVAGLIRQKGIHRFIGIGRALERQQDLFDAEKHFYPDTATFLQEFDTTNFKDETVLIKGSRLFEFEKIARRLQQKSHTTVMEINLSALAHNLKAYRSLLKPRTRVMAMVKAFSYGSGSFEIANILQFHKADYLAVAYADEGVYLRENGISLPILIMNSEERGFHSLIRHELEPELYSFRLLGSFAGWLQSNFPSISSYPVHLKLDTGMHRLGFEPQDMTGLIEELKKYPQLKVRSVFSHLAAADMPEHDDFTIRQSNDFMRMCQTLEDSLGYSFIKHLLNSSGITRFPQFQFDMVRLGLGLYGLDPTSEIQSRLEHVSTLKTHISQVKQVPTGESVGYSREGIAGYPRTIATIGLGYADGFPRTLGNGTGSVFINGHIAPIVGNICMDMTMIDITGIDAYEGDEVTVFGKEYPIERMARDMKTIPYEVLTSVSQRVKRVYYKE
nr:alanine racemase [Bacteroidota bacterium]